MMKKIVVVFSVVLAGAVILNAEIQKELYPSGKVKSEYNVENGKKNGAYKAYYENGKVEGEWVYKD